MPRTPKHRPHVHTLRGASLVTASVMAWAAVVIACNGLPDTPLRSFDPDGSDRSCTVDSDCMLVAPVDECRSCCVNEQAVRKTPELERALDHVERECSGNAGICAVNCAHLPPACMNGVCVMRVRDGG